MDLVDNIQANFNKGFYNKAMSIETLSSEYPAWTLKNDKWYGVAVAVADELNFLEKFSNAMIWTTLAEIDGKNYNLLVLSCTDEGLRSEFATICGQFVEPGEYGKLRKELVNNPQTWWNRWKILLGNTMVSNEAYSVIGEMLVYKYLKQNNDKVSWIGLVNGTQDIETLQGNYEIKSTVKRYGYEVTISSEYQMNPNRKELYLVFCRFEKSIHGYCINDLVKELTELGDSDNSLNKMLKKKGFEVGTVSRKMKYKLLEMKLYKVDSKFPAITENSFKE